MTSAGLPDARALLERRANLARLGHVIAIAAQRLDHAVVAGGNEQVGHIAAVATVFLELSEANLVPGGVVAHDADHRQVEAHERVVVEAGAAEGPVAEEHNDISLGMGDLGGKWRTACPTPSVPSGPGSIQWPGRRGWMALAEIVTTSPPSPMKIVSSVRKLVDLAGQRSGWMGTASEYRMRLVLLVARLASTCAQLVQPGPAVPAGATAAANCSSTAPASPTMPTSTSRLWPNLAVVEIDLDDLGVGGQALAVAQAEVERRADDQDDVGLRPGRAGASG